MPTEREVSLEQFRAHVAALPKGRRIDEVVVHHTWSPNSAQYRGIETVRGVRRYHMEKRGWSDNGYHVMIGPDGRIFLCRPIGRSGAHVLNRNAHTIGVSYIANFDVEQPAAYRGLTVGMQAVAALLQRFGLPVTAVRFHREFQNKSCPGRLMDLTRYRRGVADALVGEKPKPFRVVVLGNPLSQAAVELRDGATWVRLRDVAAAADLPTPTYDAAQNTVSIPKP